VNASHNINREIRVENSNKVRQKQKLNQTKRNTQQDYGKPYQTELNSTEQNWRQQLRTTLIKHKFNLCAILASRINFRRRENKKQKQKKKNNNKSTKTKK